MGYETIKVERIPLKTSSAVNVGIIYLNRPQVLNAINDVMLNEIITAVDELEADPAVRVVLLKSLCEKGFSGGIDVDYVKDLSPFDIREVGRLLHKCFGHVRRADKIYIAVSDGLCLGAGLELALSCDFMVASDRSKFGLPNINVGIPAIVEAAILIQAIGVFHTRELCYTGKFWDAQTAYQRGMLNRMVPVDKLDETVMDLASLVSTKSPKALSTQKEIIFKWMTTDMESAIDYSINTVCLNWTSRDQKEGMNAFVEKRKATFKGE